MNKLTKWDPFNAPFRWDPFRELEEMHNRLTSFFGGRFPLLGGPAEAEDITPTTWAPRVDIAENDKEYVISAELPGVKKEEVKVSVENRVLSISGERKSEKEAKRKRKGRSITELSERTGPLRGVSPSRTMLRAKSLGRIFRT